MKKSQAWIQTYTGIEFDILEPTEDMVNLIDIAHSLSMECRYGGHIGDFYSVASHSMFVEYLMRDYSPMFRLTALLHDAAEAYLKDVLRPIKRYTQMGEEYQVLEAEVSRVIFKKFGIHLTDEEWKIVKKYDEYSMIPEIKLWFPYVKLEDWNLGGYSEMTSEEKNMFLVSVENSKMMKIEEYLFIESVNSLLEQIK